MMPLPDISVVNTLYVCVCVLFTQIHVDICVHWKVDWNPIGCTVAALPEGGCHAAIPSYPFFFFYLLGDCVRVSLVYVMRSATQTTVIRVAFILTFRACVYIRVYVCVCARVSRPKRRSHRLLSCSTVYVLCFFSSNVCVCVIRFSFSSSVRVQHARCSCSDRADIR